jgi:hypothetical protein
MIQSPDERAHWIREYRINAARMRAQAYSVRNPQQRAEFEQIARELDHWADAEEAAARGDRSRT